MHIQPTDNFIKKQESKKQSQHTQIFMGELSPLTESTEPLLQESAPVAFRTNTAVTGKAAGHGCLDVAAPELLGKRMWFKDRNTHYNKSTTPMHGRLHHGTSMAKWLYRSPATTGCFCPIGFLQKKSSGCGPWEECPPQLPPNPSAPTDPACVHQGFEARAPA